MEDSNISDQKTEENPSNSGHSGKDCMSQNNGSKKKTPKRKPKNGITKNILTGTTSCLCPVDVQCLELVSCTTKQHTSDSPSNIPRDVPEPEETFCKKSLKRNVRRRGRKQDLKSENGKNDMSLTKEDSDCSSLNTPGRSNQRLPQSPVASSSKSGFWREKKRTTSNDSVTNFPSMSASLGYNKKTAENSKPCSSRNKTQSFIDEDLLFEDYLPWNVVEGLLQLPNYLRGTVRINQKAYTEAYISDPSGGRDILIEGIRNRNRALEGDEVVIAILPESEWSIISPSVKQQTGKVIYVLKAVHPRQAIGVLKPMPQKNSLQALFSPRDSRVPRMRVPITDCPPDFEKCGDALYLARIIKWDNVRFARGSLMGGSFGMQGDIDAETDAILLENQIRSTPYPPDLIPNLPECLQEEDWKNRQDLRKECIFSIDPITARDLDDAVSCEVLENGNYLVGVHISDVSYYLKENTPLDKMVAEVATTTYLVQSVYHMLPKELTMKCSLLPGEDKLAFSVFWELQETDEEVKVISHRFTRSVLNSCAQMAYEHAQVMLENPEKDWKDGELPTIYNGFTPQKLSSVVCILNRLAVKLRKKRFESGSLRIDQTKLNFRLDEDGLPLEMGVHEHKESNRLIEEFMLLANITVATALHDAYPKVAFLRQHSPPLAILMDKLKEQLEISGIIIDTSSAGALQESLSNYRDVKDLEGTARCVALNSLFAKPMARAKYFCLSRACLEVPASHYALNVPLYTHFTSPIRRYADVMVHRLLAAHLGYTGAPLWTEHYVDGVANNCNMRKYNAKKAGEQSSELFLAVYLKEKGPITGYAVVIDVKDRSFDAIFASTGTTVRIYADKIGAEVEDVKRNNMYSFVLTWFPGGERKPVRQVISLFSVVNAQLRCSTTSTLKLETTLMPPWEEIIPVDRVENEACSIDLSDVKLPDILDDVQECLYTSDDDLSSPESVCESPTPLDDTALQDVILIAGCRRL